MHEAALSAPGFPGLFLAVFWSAKLPLFALIFDPKTRRVSGVGFRVRFSGPQIAVFLPRFLTPKLVEFRGCFQVRFSGS